jgi:iron transport multicopper oxidase
MRRASLFLRARMAKIYFLNADNLGGFKRGPGQTDDVLQTIGTNHAVFGGSGSSPLEGGYVYFTPVGFPTPAYKLGFDSSGSVAFSLAGQTNESSAGRVGAGISTVTTYQGKAGTAILWLTDPDAGLARGMQYRAQTESLKRSIFLKPMA